MVRIGFGATAIVVLLFAAVAHAEVRPTKLVRVSGPSPFAGCSSASPSVPGAEDEPTIVAAGGKSKKAVVAWRQDGGGGPPVSTRAAASRNGGLSFGRPFEVPGLTACEGGPQRLVHATDPWLAQGPGSTVWFAALSFTNGNPGAIAVSRSSNGGARWSRVVFADEDDNALQFDDKPTIIGSPRNPDRAWVSWVKLNFLPPPLPSPQLYATAYVSRTDDGGSTWSPPVAAAAGGVLSGGLEGVFPSEIDRLPDGTLVLTVARSVPDIGPEGIPCLIGEQCPGNVVFDAYTSDDGGRSWSRPAMITRVRAARPSIPGAGPDDTRNSLFSTAVTRDGSLWLSFYELEGQSRSVIRLWRSRDGGRSWQRRPDPDVGGRLRLVPQIAGGKSGLALLWRETSSAPARLGSVALRPLKARAQLGGGRHRQADRREAAARHPRGAGTLPRTLLRSRSRGARLPRRSRARPAAGEAGAERHIRKPRAGIR